MKRFVALLALLVMVPAVSATDISHEDITVDLGEPSTVTIERTYSTITSESISYFVPSYYEPSGLSVSDGEGELDCEVDVLRAGREIVCSPRRNSSYTVEIRFEGTFVTQDDEDYIFSFTHRILTPTDSVDMQVVLPEGHGLANPASENYLPSNGTADTEGRRIFLKWSDGNVTLGENLNYFARYEKLEVLERFSLEQVGILLLAVVALFGILGVYYRRQGSERTLASVFPVLKDDERDVLRFIIDAGKEVEQREIVENIDYSKAKISKLLSDLEERNLVEKEKQGRINVVRLAREVGDISDFRSG